MRTVRTIERPPPERMYTGDKMGKMPNMLFDYTEESVAYEDAEKYYTSRLKNGRSVSIYEYDADIRHSMMLNGSPTLGRMKILTKWEINCPHYECFDYATSGIDVDEKIIYNNYNK